ncbi:hypothetical protein AB0G02_27035 [Actinosynnema sp. NPDC023658]|uniref:hypothetical protein n=1 Tax=Actinosynnema sp. NPDC023658 TaxID=3155465 RepID=UPI0034117216
MEPNGDDSARGTGSGGPGARRELSFEELLAQLDGPDQVDLVPDGPATHAVSTSVDDDITAEDGLGDLDLDGMLADMAAAPTAEARAAVRGQALRLFESITNDVDADRGSAPAGGSPPPVVPHDTADGALFTAFDPDHLAVTIDDTTDAGIVQLIIAGGGYGLTAATLGVPVADVRTRFLAFSDGNATVDPHEPHVVVLSTLLAAKPKLRLLCDRMRAPDLDISLPQAAACEHFLEVYPEFWGNLAAKNCTIVFNSSRADSRGGGLYEPGDRVIHMSRLSVTPPGAFVRLLVHETGHALFESTLLDDHPMPPALGTGTVAHLASEYDPLPSGAYETKDLHRDGHEIRQLQVYWDRMSSHAKAFYHAWLILRGHRQHLLCLDLWRDPKGNRLSPEQRRSYQADKFDEFCAEVFMQYALGDLRPYLVTLLADARVEDTVKRAWRNAWRVLEVVATPLLGPRHD